AIAIAKREAEQAKITFGQTAEMRWQAKSPEFRNPKHSAQWISSLREYARPIWDKPTAEVTADEVYALLLRHWTTKTETMTRVRQRIEDVFRFAPSAGHRDKTAENPARWLGNLEFRLPKPSKLKKVEHHSALPWRDVPAFMVELAKREGSAA